MVDESKSKKKAAQKSTTPQESSEAGPSRILSEAPTEEQEGSQHSQSEEGEEEGQTDEEDESQDEFDGMDPEGFAGESNLKPLTPEALATFKAAQDRAGVIYISRIPPGMRPAKVRHLMSAYGPVGRVYLQQEGWSFFIQAGMNLKAIQFI